MSRIPVRAQGDGHAKFNQRDNILIADQFNHRVIEIDREGRIAWQFGDGSNIPGPTSIVGPQDVERVGSLTLIAGGGVPPGVDLGCSTGCFDHRVIQVNRKGKIVWQYGQAGVAGTGTNQLNHPVGVALLPGRKVLITDQDNHRVIKVDMRKNEILKQYGMKGVSCSGTNEFNRPSSAQLLRDDHVLIADTGNHRVVELNKHLEIAWQYGDPNDTGILNNPTFASRLGNGNTLITDSGNNRILELNREGQVIFLFQTNTRPGSVSQPHPTHAVRLKDGNTLISDQMNHQVIEIDPFGNIVFSYGMIGAAGMGESQLNGPHDAKVINDFTGLTFPRRKGGGGSINISPFF